MKFARQCFCILLITATVFSIQAKDPSSIFEEIAHLREEMASAEPTLTAADPFLDAIQAKAKKLIALLIDGKAYAPAGVYFCSEPDSMDCPNVYADDTFHLYEAESVSQFIVPSKRIKIILSPELAPQVEVFRGNMGDLHNLSYAGLKVIRVSKSYEMDLKEAKGQGKQVLLIFAKNHEHQRVKFVWLMDGLNQPLQRTSGSSGRR